MTATLNPDAGVARRSPLQLLGGAEQAIIVVLLGVCIGGAVTTDGFSTVTNLRAVLVNASIGGILAVAMTPITMSGSMVSLAAGQSTMLAAVIFAGLVGTSGNVGLAALVVVMVLLVLGVAQGVVVSAGLNPIITTLAAGGIVVGSVLAATESARVSLDTARVSWLGSAQPLGVPSPVLIFVVFTTVVTWFVHRTPAGRRIRLVGANPLTAVLSGVSVKSTVTLTFVVLSIGAAIGGMVAVSTVGTADALFLPSLGIDAIAAILVGGTAIQGGSGSPARSAAGALMITSIDNIMVLHGLSVGERMFAKGVLVVAVVVFLNQVRRSALHD